MFTPTTSHTVQILFSAHALRAPGRIKKKASQQQYNHGGRQSTHSVDWQLYIFKWHTKRPGGRLKAVDDRMKRRRRTDFREDCHTPFSFFLLRIVDEWLCPIVTGVFFFFFCRGLRAVRCVAAVTGSSIFEWCESRIFWLFLSEKKSERRAQKVQYRGGTRDDDDGDKGRATQPQGEGSASV